MPDCFFFFFFNDPATTEIYTVGNTLSLHDALPICCRSVRRREGAASPVRRRPVPRLRSEEHTSELQSLPTISYAVFCLKKKLNSNQLLPTILDFFYLLKKREYV